MTVNPAEMPIGYWLKRLHDLIEMTFEATLADLGLSRRHWQILNLLSETTRTRAEIEEALAPFWQEGTSRLDESLDGKDGLVTRGWVRHDTGSDHLILTDHGRTAYGRAAARVAEVRRQLAAGVTPEQYAETVRILSVMAGNLERTLAAKD